MKIKFIFIGMYCVEDFDTCARK